MEPPFHSPCAVRAVEKAAECLEKSCFRSSFPRKPEPIVPLHESNVDSGLRGKDE